MNILTRMPAYTPEDLLRLPDAKGFELVDGQLVELNIGAEAGWVSNNCTYLLTAHSREHKLGWMLGAEIGYQCYPDAPNKLRKPDGSFIRFGRLPGEKIPVGWIRIAPDMVLESVSPNDLYYEVLEKVLEYMTAGIRLIWVIDPHSHVVHVYRPDGSVRLLRESDMLDGEDVVPGFRCSVREIFAPPPGAPSVHETNGQ